MKEYLKKQKLSSEYFYNSLTLCVIDSVFSIGIRYETVRKVIDKYCNASNLKKYRDKEDIYPPINEQDKISDLIKRYKELGDLHMRDQIFRNKNKTSSRSGVDKSEAVLMFCEVLKIIKIC
jgi:hypothetical protein